MTAALTDERLGRPSASEFERVMNCDGYLALKRSVEHQRVRPRTENAAATQGTELHALNESGDVTNATYSESEIVQIIRDRELILVRQWCDDMQIPFDEIKIEREVRLWFMDACSAKLDVLVTFGTHGFYLDTKTGRNPVPPPSKNWQMRVGAICARHGRQLDHVRTAIVNVFGTLMPPCDYPYEDLHQIARMVSKRLMDVEDGGETKLGPWCAYCPCIHVCDSQRDQMALAIQQRTINWSMVSAEQKKPLFIAAKMAVAAGTAILDQIKADISHNPDSCPGLSKKQDGSTRKITDLTKASLALHAETGGLDVDVMRDVLKKSSISLENFTTLYRDMTGVSKADAEKWLETKCGGFIEKSPRSGSVSVKEEP